MDRNFAKSLALVLKHEGGWSDHPADPGGATMKGVTLANFRRYVKADATKADLRKITDAQLATVYRRFYWDAVAGAELPDGVDFAVFDFAVNSGPGRAAKYLQAVVGAKQDGRIGPATMTATRAKPHAAIINDLCDNRMAFLKSLKTWPTFGKGWTTRVKDVRSKALEMAARPLPLEPAKPTPAGIPSDGPLSTDVPAPNSPKPPLVDLAVEKPRGSNILVAGVTLAIAGFSGLISWLAGLPCDVLGVLCR